MIIAIAGAGLKTLLFGVLLLVAGLPIYWWSIRQR